MTNYLLSTPLELVATPAKLCAICISIAVADASSAQTVLTQNPLILAQTKVEWEKDVTALVIAPDGT